MNRSARSIPHRSTSLPGAGGRGKSVAPNGRRVWQSLLMLSSAVFGTGVFWLALGAGPQEPLPQLPADGAPPANQLTLQQAAPSLFERIDPGIQIPPPRIRVSLRGDAGQIKVGCSNGAFRLLDGRTGQEIWPDRAKGTVLIAPEGGGPANGDRVQRIQVGAFRDGARAKERADQLGQQFQMPAEAVFDANRGVWRVRIGRADRANGLTDLLDEVRRAGFPDAFLTSEPKAVPVAASSGGLRLIDSRWESRLAGTDRVVLVPGGESRAVVDGRPYRGLVEVLRTAGGGVLAINELPLEDYLRGVVPEELGPGLFPEFEAQKAQAVAARTYAYANLGQFSQEGFDLCDTPRCQVYGGAASEQPLSDQAVIETRGEILIYDTKPIMALFTSTCGGHTEDVETVFPEWNAPYLRGIPCRPPPQETAQRMVWVTGKAVEPDMSPSVPGEPTALELGQQVALGIAPREAFSGTWRAEVPTAEEVTLWATAFAQVTGRPAPRAFAGEPQRKALWRWLGEAFLSTDLASGIVAPGDENLVLPAVDRDQLDPEIKPILAAWVTRGVVRPAFDGRFRPQEKAPRGEILGWLARLGSTSESMPLRDGYLVGEGDGGIRIKERKATVDWALDQAPDLFAEAGGGWHRVTQLDLLPGDKVIFGVGDRGKLVLLGMRERKSASDDRGSPRFRWTVVRDREALEKRLAEILPVGTLQDLTVLRRGRSGRIAALEIRGSGGRATVEGFRFARVVDLPESQFTFEIQRDWDKKIRRVVFTGRGWGHGVGLCQYGAFGMAQRGASYREILAHYYTGAGLSRLP